MEVWRYGGMEVWRCRGVEVWRCVKRLAQKLAIAFSEDFRVIGRLCNDRFRPVNRMLAMGNNAPLDSAPPTGRYQPGTVRQ